MAKQAASVLVLALLGAAHAATPRSAYSPAAAPAIPLLSPEEPAAAPSLAAQAPAVVPAAAAPAPAPVPLPPQQPTDFSVPAPAPAPSTLAPLPAVGDSKCLLQWLQQRSEYSTLLTLVRTAPAASGLTDRLQNSTAGITLFAPDNQAVNQTLNTLHLGLAGLLASPMLCQKIIQYHILPNYVSFNRMQDGFAFNTLLPSQDVGGQAMPSQDEGGQALTASRSGNQVTLRGGKVDVTLKDQGQQVCQDLVYRVDNMIIPATAVNR